MWEKGESFMPCTEAYKEHITYTFNGFCKTIIHYVAINAWRDRNRHPQKKYPLNTSQKFTAPCF